MVMYVVLGCLMDALAMVILTVPIIFPVIKELGFDPIWFGVIIVMTVELGLIHPPVGMIVFVIKSVIQDINFSTIFLFSSICLASAASAAGLAINSEKAAASIGRSISTSCVEAMQTHMRDGSHNAMIGKAIRITSRMRSVAMNGSTPAKIVEKFMSWITLFMTNTTIPTGG